MEVWAFTHLASYPGVWGGGGAGGGVVKEKNAWYTLFAHAFNFRKSQKLGYFSNPPRNVDVNFNNH